MASKSRISPDSINTNPANGILHVVRGVEGKLKCIYGFSCSKDQMLRKKCQCKGKEQPFFKIRNIKVEETQF